MKIHEAGRETSHLKDIKTGTKVIEGRLARGKFLNFRVGDHVRLREDLYEDGVEVGTIPNRLTTKIIKIDRYPTFKDMLSKVGYKKVLPRALSVDEAVRQYYKYYSPEEESKYGVIAIHFELVH